MRPNLGNAKPPCPPIALADEALELLHTYVTNDGDIHSVVDWDGSRCDWLRANGMEK